MNQGIYVNITNADYHASEGISKSGLDIINNSPMHFKYAKNNPQEQTKAMLQGSLFHTMVLEPEKIDLEYAVAPQVDKRTKQGKEVYALFCAASQGKIVVDAEDMDLVREMQKAVYAHPLASKLLAKGDNEQSVYWYEGKTLCKCRPDKINNYLIDLKSTKSANPTDFIKSAYDYRYHVQSWWYLHGYEIATGIKPQGFIFIAVEKTPPYAVCVYIADDAMLKAGEEDARANLATYEECMRTGNWYGYDGAEPSVQSLSIPSWEIHRRGY